MTKITSRAFRRAALTMGAASTAAMLMLGGMTAATAATTGISGTQGVPSTVHWSTARTNTFAKNSVAFDITDDPGSGGSFILSLRNSAGTTFASGTYTGQSGWITIKNKNGNAWQPAGTFYLTSYISGACGGSGCGAVSWAANLQYNERYF
ncbi:hypothetical protein [Agromyces soli]|uniref:Uncharacterized protein n=1 Tax=Agromyces soli TaxID=659012 RepID=A0ABY4AUU8_9MICO|nr:hypothetical protein [Agromyces soli]UOE26579.1 hypothetical protein MTP13_02005 [Agromyces soli]